MDELVASTFPRYGRLTIRGFYLMLEELGFGDLGSSPFASFVFQGLCDSNNSETAGFANVRVFVHRLKAASDVHAGLVPPDAPGLSQAQYIETHLNPDVRPVLNGVLTLERKLEIGAFVGPVDVGTEEQW